MYETCTIVFFVNICVIRDVNSAFSAFRELQATIQYGAGQARAAFFRDVRKGGARSRVELAVHQTTFTAS